MNSLSIPDDRRFRLKVVQSLRLVFISLQKLYSLTFAISAKTKNPVGGRHTDSSLTSLDDSLIHWLHKSDPYLFHISKIVPCCCDSHFLLIIWCPVIWALTGGVCISCILSCLKRISNIVLARIGLCDLISSHLEVLRSNLFLNRMHCLFTADSYDRCDAATWEKQGKSSGELF